eukprot:GFYU01009622.1.p1 GENE.GFYU01009622.1~~GFYU01009622.1.p1  ORF type:complete len:188 (-),score=10.13 GFYU01009622.1:650-1213(-)
MHSSPSLSLGCVYLPLSVFTCSLRLCPVYVDGVYFHNSQFWHQAGRLRQYGDETEASEPSDLAYDIRRYWEGVDLEGGWKGYIHGVGVDAGTAGFVDADNYRDVSEMPPIPDAFIFTRDHRPIADYGERWNSVVFTTEGEVTGQGACIPHGCCSRSGYGDGCYGAHYKMAGEHVAAVRLVFVWPEEE